MPAETVKVVVRVRPMNGKERDQKCLSCVEIDEKLNQITLFKAGNIDQKNFTYDYVFGISAFQQSIYENSAFPLVENVVEGYNGTIFAYGQTGCGKTHTMIGVTSDDVHKGIIPRTFDHIISVISTADSANKKYLVRCAYIEIYNEEVHDLLGKDVKAKMELKESTEKGVFIKDLTIHVVKSVSEMDKYMNVGTAARSVGATAMNQDSSRSHCIFTVFVECQITDDKGNALITGGKLNLVDLAGSERQSKTQATGDRLKEAVKINLSLSALGNVISALVDGKSQHIPYRDSKLTRLLQDSLYITYIYNEFIISGGNTKTIMIAAVSPADYNYDETWSTLRYASRAKLIKNQPKVNEDPKDAQLKEYADEIKLLKEMLLKAQGGVNTDIANQQGANSPLHPIIQKDRLPLQLQLQQPTSQQSQRPNDNNQNIQSKEIQQPQQPQQNGQAPDSSFKQKQIANNNQNNDLQKQLQSANQNLQKQKEKLEQDMREQEEQRIKDGKEREKLEQMIYEKEQQMMVGGHAGEDEKKKYLQLQMKIRQQKKEHEKLVGERLKNQEELLKMEKNHKSVNDELDQLRKLVNYLRKKYQDSLNEIKDLEKEQEYSKEDHLETIRQQDKEIKQLTGILKMILTNDEIENVRGACVWNDDQEDYQVPPFVLRSKRIKYPKLPGAQAHDLIEKEKLDRDLVYDYHNSGVENEMRSTKNHFHKNNNAPLENGRNKYSYSPSIGKKYNNQNDGSNELGMHVNESLRSSGSINNNQNNQKVVSLFNGQNTLIPPAPEKRQFLVQLQPIQQEFNQPQQQVQQSRIASQMSSSQLPANSIFMEQFYNTPDSAPKPNKAVILQPMDRPPIVPRNDNPFADVQDQKKQGKKVKLDKIA